MKRTTNQNMFHATIDGKKTVCGLSNQYKIADTVDVFNGRLKDASYIKYCCKKCENSILTNR